MTHLLHNKSRLSSSAANEQSKTKQQISIYSDIESLNFQTPQGCGIVLGKEVLLISSDHPKLNFSASLFKVQPLLHAAISQFSSVKRDWGTAPFVLLSCFNTNLGPQGTAPSTHPALPSSLPQKPQQDSNSGSQNFGYPSHKSILCIYVRQCTMWPTKIICAGVIAR